MSKPDDVVAESLTTDRAFDLLRDGTRRRVLAVLRETDGLIPLHELAAEVAARDEGVAPDQVSDDRRQRTATSLHHCHLPKLEASSVVEYDHIVGMVESTPLVEELTACVEGMRAEVNHLDA